MLPGPGQYKESSKTPSKAATIPKQDRFKKNEYETDSTGPGAYRVQDGFGMYSINNDLRSIFSKSRNSCATV